MSKLYVTAAFVLAGCYMEVGAGYFPRVKETVTTSAGPQRAESSGFSAMFKLGFYLDIPIAPLRTAIGLGLSPFGMGGDAIVPSNTQSKITPSGTEKRLDVTLPIMFGNYIAPRLTLAHLHVYDANVDIAPNDDYVSGHGSGRTWFFGGTIGGVLKNGTLVQMSIGAQSQSVTAVAHQGTDGVVPPIEMTAFGPAIRIMAAWTPTGAFMAYYHPTPSEPQKRGNAGCYTRTQCDVSGNCRSDWYCP
jgi:hypothetical protein